MYDVHVSDFLSRSFPLWLLAGHLAFGKDGLVTIGRIHYFFHWLYGKYEPQVLQLVDWTLKKKLISNTRPGRWLMTAIATLSHYLPHGVVVPTEAAINLVRHIETLKGDEDGPRLAVGPCVCQMSLDRWQEPSCKDLVVLYGADIYLHLDRGYRVITADEAAAMLEQCRNAGLVHCLDFCMQSQRWHFVICSCDTDICVLARTYLVTGKMLYPGPWIVRHDRQLCLGPDECGLCIEACMFGANRNDRGVISVDGSRCLGCGQCLRVCRGKARELLRRKKYRHEHIFPTELLEDPPLPKDQNPLHRA